MCFSWFLKSCWFRGEYTVLTKLFCLMTYIKLMKQNVIFKFHIQVDILDFSSLLKATPLVSTRHTAYKNGDRCGQCAGVRSCHCGMDMCSNLSLVSQHMCGWPCSGYYCNLGAIDSNPLFLLVWKLIIPLHAGRHAFTKDDLQSWYKKIGSVVAHVVYHYQLISNFFLVVWRGFSA